MIELQVYASLLSRRAQTFLLTIIPRANTRVSFGVHPEEEMRCREWIPKTFQSSGGKLFVGYNSNNTNNTMVRQTIWGTKACTSTIIYSEQECKWEVVEGEQSGGGEMEKWTDIELCVWKQTIKSTQFITIWYQTVSNNNSTAFLSPLDQIIVEQLLRIQIASCDSRGYVHPSVGQSLFTQQDSQQNIMHYEWPCFCPSTSLDNENTIDHLPKIRKIALISLI